MLIMMMVSQVPDVLAGVGGEQAEDEGVGCRVERCQTLDEGGHRHGGGVGGDQAKHLTTRLVTIRSQQDYFEIILPRPRLV